MAVCQLDSSLLPSPQTEEDYIPYPSVHEVHTANSWHTTQHVYTVLYSILSYACVLYRCQEL